MSYRIIALDLDGTLLNNANQIPAENARAILAAKARGVTIVCASGRMTDSTRRIPRRLGLDEPVISYNGAMARDSIRNGDTQLFHMPLAAEHAAAVVEYTRANNFHLNYYLDGCLYSRDDATLRRFAELYRVRTGSVHHFVPDLSAFTGKQPTKLILITDPSDPARPDPRHRDEQRDYWLKCCPTEPVLVCTDPEYLEFMHPLANKGSALAKVAEHLGVAREEVIAVGDGHNDTAMIEWAGLGVAVANAHAEVKAAADYVCERTNNESAVAEVINKFVLDPKTIKN
jgi:Cof subfamily protein (haloacid dehalogenase superfamily)